MRGLVLHNTSQMGWLDILLGLSLALSTIEGIKRGFFHEVAGFVGLVAGFFIAVCLDKPIGLFLSQHAGIPTPLAGVLGFLLPFAATIIAAQLAATFLNEISKGLSLNGLNRVAGGAFALFKQVVILSILLNIYELFDSDKSLIGIDRIQHSRLYTPVLKAAPALFPSFPDVSLQSEPEEPTEPTLIV